jgi:hypothetical protein
VRYIKSYASNRISRLFAVRIRCSFCSLQERWNQVSPEKYGRLITLYDSCFHISAPHSIGGFCCHMYWLIDRLIMMGWDYVSELWPPTSLLFIPRVTCQHGGPWWWWCRLGITSDSSTRALWQPYRQRHLRQAGGTDEGVRILPISIWNTSRDLQHAVKSYGMGPSTSLAIRRKVCCGFLSPFKIHRLGRVWTRDPWAFGKHTSYYTTKATTCTGYSCS